MATYSELEQLYLAYFGRPPELAALNYYRDFTVAQVEAAFEASAESRQVYANSAGQADAAMVNTAYQHLFNRTPSQAEVQYWVEQGSARGLTPSALAIVIAANSLGSDNTAAANRMAYVQQWVSTFSDKANNVNFGDAAAAKLAMQQLTSITDDPGSLTKAITATDIALTPGGTSGGDTTGGTGGGSAGPVTNLILTTGSSDVVLGTAAGETIHAITGTGATLNTGDTIDGADGIDTLSIVNSTAANIVLSSDPVTNIEKLQLKTTAAAFTVDATGVAGLTDVTNDGSAATVTVTGLANLVNLAVQNTGSGTTLAFAGTALAGNADALALSLNNVTGGAVVKLLNAAGGANQLETLDIASSGTANSITLATVASQTSLRHITISGSAHLDLAFATNDTASFTAAAFIDSSIATGGVTIGSIAQALGTATSTITLGTGTNLVYMGTGFTSVDSVTATAGSDDTIAVSSAVAAGAANILDGVETLRFYGSMMQNMSLTSGISRYQIEGANSAISLITMANNTVVEVLGGNSLAMGLMTNGSTDSLTLKFTPTDTAGATLALLSNVAALSNTETLNIVSNAVTGQTSANTIGNDAVAAKQILTGSGDFTVTLTASTDANFDASAFTGHLNITGQDSIISTIKGGLGNDSITLGTGDGVVGAGAGDDIVYTAALNTTSHVNRGGDSLTLGAGNDTVVFADNLSTGNGAATSYAANTAHATIIMDFAVGASASATDKFAFSGNDASYQLTSNNGAGTASTGLAKGATAQGLTAGDTMVVQNVASTGAVAAAADVSFFKLTDTSNLMLTGHLSANFAAAMGSASITGLAANGNYVVSMFDPSNGITTVAIVNTGGSGDGDTTLSAADFVDHDVAVVGVMLMNAGGYGNFGASHLATVL